MDISWEDARVFLAVAEQRSFSAAARHLGLGQPTISRRIAVLEETLGAALFWRGKAGAELTPEGARLLPAAQQMARWAAELGRLADGAAEAISGTVRIAAPPGIAVELLAPLAALARRELPGIRLEVYSSIEHVDLSRGSADLAIRTRRPTEPELAVLHETAVTLGVFASAAYAATLPERPEVADLEWVSLAFPYEHLPPRPMLERRIENFQPVFASDDYLALKSAVAAGLGAMVMDRAVVGIARPSPLVEVAVADLVLPTLAWYLVCAKSVRWVPRVRAVAELILAQLENPSFRP
jgi:DNA-binding transcriptional LysR family regulator